MSAEWPVILFWLAVFVDAVGEAVVFCEGVVVVESGVLFAAWHEIENEGRFFVATGVAHTDVAEDAEGGSADEIDEEIAHGVVKPNVEIAGHGVGGAVGGVDDGFGDVWNVDDFLAVVRIKVDGIDTADQRILLHVHEQKMIGAPFKKFPDNADGHREAEGDHDEIEW